MKIITALRRAAYLRYLSPIVGRMVDRSLRWIHSQDGWAEIVSAVVHVRLETTSPVKMRTGLTEMIQDIGPHLGADSREVLQHIDEIVQKHLPEMN